MYVVTAKWLANPGEEENIVAILATMTPLTRAEPGCRLYLAHRSLEDPRVFFLYEQYDDEAAFKAHADADYFKQHVLGDAVPRLEARERAFYEILD
jgi:quinol monooxygenase YgiN